MAFKRSIILRLNFIPITGIRIDCEITKSDAKEVNTAIIKLYNISPLTRNIFSKTTKIPVQIDAGYLDVPPSPVFIGRMKHVETKEEGKNTVTIIEADDDAFGIEQGTTVSLPPGGPAANVVALMSVQSGAALATPIVGSFIYQNGFAFIGTIKQCLNDVVINKMNKTWSIQNGLLYILDEDAPRIAAPVLLSPINGLLFRVEKVKEDDDGKTKKLDLLNQKTKWKFTNIFMSRVDIGITVQITSQDFIGAVKVKSQKIMLSTHENNFWMENIGVEL